MGRDGWMVYQRIADYNDRQGDDTWAKWSVSARALKDISKVHQNVEKRWFEANAERVSAMHKRHGLRPSHNTSNARKGLSRISESFTMERPKSLMNGSGKARGGLALHRGSKSLAARPLNQQAKRLGLIAAMPLNHGSLSFSAKAHRRRLVVEPTVEAGQNNWET